MRRVNQMSFEIFETNMSEDRALKMEPELKSVARSRGKRFVFNANSTCGYIAYCGPDIHQYDLVLNTSLADNPSCSKPALLFSVLFNVLVAIFIMFGNFMIIKIMTSKEKFRNPQGVFKTSLAIFDFLVGAIILPSTIYNKISIMFFPLEVSYLQYLAPYEHSTASIVLGMLFSICISGSLFSLLALTIDRLMAVHWPFKYSQGKLMTSARAAGVFVAIMFLSVILGVLAVGDEERFHYDLDYMTMNFMLDVKINPSRRPPNLRHGIFFLVLVFIIPYVCVVMVTAITWLMFWWNRRKARKEKMKSMAPVAGATITVTSVEEDAAADKDLPLPGAPEPPTSSEVVESSKANLSPAPQSKPRQKKKARLENAEDKDLEKMTIIMVIMVASFTVCVLPFLAVQAYSISPYSGELEYMERTGRTYPGCTCYPKMHLLVVELLFLNSLCNFVIYNLRNEAFKKEMQRTLKSFTGRFTDRWQ